MRYTIEFEYSTGDSFNNYDTTGELGITWENLDRAKEALARIREIDEVEKENSPYQLRPVATPRRLEDCRGYSKEFPEVCIMLPLDDGTEHRHSTFWRGYFEHLRVARIVQVKEEGSTDMEYRAE